MLSQSLAKRTFFQRIAREVLMFCRILACFESTIFVPEGMHAAESVNVGEPEANGKQGF